MKTLQRRKVIAPLLTVSSHDMYKFQELASDGSEKGAPQKLGYIDVRTKIQLAAPTLSRSYLDHVFALAHAAKGGPVDVIEMDEKRGALKWSARLSRVVP